MFPRGCTAGILQAKNMRCIFLTIVILFVISSCRIVSATSRAERWRSLARDPAFIALNDAANHLDTLYTHMTAGCFAGGLECERYRAIICSNMALLDTRWEIYEKWCGRDGQAMFAAARKQYAADRIARYPGSVRRIAGGWRDYVQRYFTEFSYLACIYTSEGLAGSVSAAALLAIGRAGCDYLL